MPRVKTTNTYPTNMGIQNASNYTTTKETTTNLNEKKLDGYRFYVNEKATFHDGKTAINRKEIVDAIKEEGGMIVKSVNGKDAHNIIVVVDAKSSENVGSTFVSVEDLLDFLCSDDKEATFTVKVIRDDADANKENEKALANKSFCFTGVFQDIGTNRKNAKAALHRYVKKNGATVSAKVTRQTNFLVVGLLGGASYVKAAREFGARIVTIENVEKYAKTKDEKFLESDEKLAEKILAKDEKKKVASRKRKVNASNLDDDLAAAADEEDDEDDDDDDDEDDDDDDDDYNDDDDDDDVDDDDFNNDDLNAFENADAMNENNDDEFDDDNLAAAVAEERLEMEKLGMKFRRTNFSNKKLSSNRRSSKTPAKATTLRRSSRATKPTTTSLAKLPKRGEEQRCAGGENCKNGGMIKEGADRFLANPTEGVFCGYIDNGIVDSRNLVRYLCETCAYPETKCTQCGKGLPGGNSHRVKDKVNGGWKCEEGRCKDAAGKEAANTKWPETKCTRCGKGLPEGSTNRVKDKVNGGWKCREDRCQGAAGKEAAKEAAKKKLPEAKCTRCGKGLPGGYSHRVKDKVNGGWKCREGYCQGVAGKEAAKKKWPKAKCTRCKRLLPEGNKHRVVDKEKKESWTCPKDRGCGGKK